MSNGLNKEIPPSSSKARVLLIEGEVMDKAKLFPAGVGLQSISNTAVIVQWHYSKWLSVYYSIIQALRSAGSDRAFLLDISDFTFPRVGSPRSVAARQFGLRSPIQKFFERLGVEYVHLKPSASPHNNALTVRVGERLRLGVESQALSFFADGRIDAVGPLRTRYRKKNLSRATGLLSILADTIRNIGITHLVIPSGRFACQVACAIAAEEAGISVSYSEVGMTPKSYLWETYKVHDRIKSQEHAIEEIPKYDQDVVSTVFQDWFLKRSSGTNGSNEFARRWEKEGSVPANDYSIEYEWAFFTSSRDEFSALGADWHLDSWADQYQAFSACLDMFPDYKAVLRIHPNLLTKNRVAKELEFSAVRRIGSKYPNLTIVWPDSKTNSYSLIGRSRRIMVANSTIGLEASALGKPVWCAAANYFDEVADIRKVWNKADLTIENLKVWKVDASKAKSFVAFLHLRERELIVPYTFWHQIDRILWPLRIRESFLPGEISGIQILSFISSRRYIRPATKNFT